MASSYSTKLRFELPATGEQSGTWGQVMNLFMGTLLEDALSGISTFSVTGADYTLSTANGATDEARRAILNVTGSPAAARNVILPTVPKRYLVQNICGQTVTFKTSGGTGAAIPASTWATIYCDGTNTFQTSVAYGPGTTSLGGLSVSGTLSVTGATTLSSTLAVTGASTFTGAATANGGLTVSGGGVPVGVTADNTTGESILLAGRTSDSYSMLRATNRAATTEYGRLAFSATNVALQVNAASKTAWTSDMSGNVTFPQNVAVSGSTSTVGITATYDITTYRAATPGTGYIFFGNTASRWIGWDGSNIACSQGTIWHTGNLTPSVYAPIANTSLTGLTTQTSGRFVSKAAGGNPSVCVWDTSQGSCLGMMLGTSNVMYWAAFDGAGAYAGTWRCYVDSSNNFVAGGNVGSSSDRRLKENIAALGTADAERIVSDLAGATSWFDWRDSRRPGRQLGFIAQDVQQALDQAVTAGEDGMLAVHDRPIVAALLRHVASLTDRVRALEAAHA